jgi:hypothetical protein
LKVFNDSGKPAKPGGSFPTPEEGKSKPAEIHPKPGEAESKPEEAESKNFPSANQDLSTGYLRFQIRNFLRRSSVADPAAIAPPRSRQRAAQRPTVEATIAYISAFQKKLLSRMRRQRSAFRAPPTRRKPRAKFAYKLGALRDNADSG